MFVRPGSGFFGSESQVLRPMMKACHGERFEAFQVPRGCAMAAHREDDDAVLGQATTRLMWLTRPPSIERVGAQAIDLPLGQGVCAISS